MATSLPREVYVGRVVAMRASDRDVRRYVREALAIGLEPDDAWVTRAASNNPGWTEAEIRQLVVAFGERGACSYGWGQELRMNERKKKKKQN